MPMISGNAEGAVKSPRVTLACDCVLQCLKNGKLPYLASLAFTAFWQCGWLCLPRLAWARHSLDLDTRQLFLRNKAWNLLLEPTYYPPTLPATVTLALTHLLYIALLNITISLFNLF